MRPRPETTPAEFDAHCRRLLAEERARQPRDRTERTPDRTACNDNVPERRAFYWEDRD